MGAACTVGQKEILVNSSLKVTKKIGYGHLKYTDERSRAILASCLTSTFAYYSSKATGCFLFSSPEHSVLKGSF